MRKRSWWCGPAVVLCTVFCVGCFSFAVNYSSVTALLQAQSGAVGQIIQLLDAGNAEAAADQLDDLHEAVVQARSMLAGTLFEGAENTLTDPFTLEPGTCRVTVRTEGFVIVKAIPVANPDAYEVLFNLSRGKATMGASTLYVSNGERIMLEFDNIGEPYELWFEELS